MKKLSFTLSAFILFLAGFSQEITPVFENKSLEVNRLKITSQNYYSSNALHNDFMDKFIFGGEITPEIKDRALGKMGRVNSLGAEIEQQITHYSPEIHPIGNENYGLILSFSDNHLVSSNLSTDLFSTIFYGNAGTIGDTMNFSYSHFQYQHYQKIGFGLFDKRTLSSIQLNYVAGSKAIEGRLADSWMLSETDTVSILLQGAGYRTDRFYPYWGFQGSGFSIDLNYNFMFETKNGKNQVLNLKINNLGMVVWNEQTHNYNIDSLSKYSGFAIQDFINRPEDAEEKAYNFEDTLGLQSSQGRTIRSLPIEFSLQKLPIRGNGQTLQYIAGFKTILTSDYFPYIFGGVYYEPTVNFSGSTRLSYGGFGGLQWGIDFNYWIKENAYISVGTFDMIGNISKKYGFGRSLNLSAYFKL